MKKTVALIVRFLLIILSVWGIFQKLGYHILTLSPQILDYTFVNSILVLVCYVMLFVTGISKKPDKKLLYFKSVLTLSSVVVFLVNLKLILPIMSFDWMLGILIPLLVVFDWAFFERKIHFEFKDCFIRYGIFISMILCLALIHILLFRTGNVFYVMGFRDNVIGFAGLMFLAFFVTLLMYLFDVIKGALNRKRTKKNISMIYRILIIVLNLFSVYIYTNFDFSKILSNFKYFHVLLCLITAIFLIFEILYTFLKHKTYQNYYTMKLKGTLLVSNIVVLISYIIFGGNIESVLISEILTYLVCPVLFILDWFIFDKKGKFGVLDPLVWSLLPFMYFCVVTTFIKYYKTIYPVLFSLSQPEMFIGYYTGIVFVGYLLFFTDKIAYKLRK